jgi:hypothetical protein
MFHVAPSVILADIFELLGSLVGLLVLVMWVIRQIVEANKQAGPPKGPPPAAPQGPQVQPQPARAQQAGQQADPLRNQVEEFLRRAGRVRPDNQQGPAQPRGRGLADNQIEVLVDDAPASKERRPLAEPFRPVEHTTASSATPPVSGPRRTRPTRQPVTPRRETVADHVAENVTAHSRALAEQSARLGQRIVEEDHHFDVQLRAKFDHTVGTLTEAGVVAAEQPKAVAEEAAPAAGQIASLLVSPEGLRQAIVLNEILRRPADRW